jgi:hypothetical protein
MFNVCLQVNNNARFSAGDFSFNEPTLSSPKVREFHNLAGKVILQNSYGYPMLQIAVGILAVMFFIA